MIEAQIQTT